MALADDPAHALKLIFDLKFQSKESSIVENILILSNLNLKHGFGAVCNKFRDCQKQLSVLEPKLDLNILSLFLMCAIETGWTSRYGEGPDFGRAQRQARKRSTFDFASSGILRGTRCVVSA